MHDILFNANITSFSTDTCIKHCSQLECYDYCVCIYNVIIKRNGDKDLPVLYSLKASSVLMDIVGDLYSHCSRWTLISPGMQVFFTHWARDFFLKVSALKGSVGKHFQCPDELKNTYKLPISNWFGWFIFTFQCNC